MSLMILSTDVDAVAQAENKNTFVLKNLTALAPIVLVYLFLAFYRIDYQSFWTDEVLSLKAAAPEQSFFSRDTFWYHGQGPLYFALLHTWIKLGDSEFVIRSLSAFLGLASVFLIYGLGLRLVDRQFATVSAVLLATSPFFIWYSQETRYVALAISTSLLSMYSFHRALVTNSLRAWVFYAIATTTALFSFVPLALIPVAQGLYLLLSSERWRKIPKWMAWQAGSFVIFGLWLVMSYGGVSISSAPGSTTLAVRADPLPLATGTSRELSATVIPYTFLTFSGGFSIGPSVEELHVSRDMATVLEHVSTLAPLALLYGTLFLFGVVRLLREPHVGGWLLVWLAIPIAGVFVLAATTNVAYNVRYACAAMPAYILILAGGITKVRGRRIQLTVLSAVLLANAFSLAQYYFNPRYAKADARRAARYLESAGDRNDVILLAGSSAAWRYYYKGDLPVVTWSRSANNSRETVSKNVENLTNRYNRIWLVAVRPWETDPKGNVKAVLDQSLQNTQVMALPGVEISSYIPKLPLSQVQAHSP